jgi:hypothetical protein
MLNLRDGLMSSAIKDLIALGILVGLFCLILVFIRNLFKK